MKTLKVCCSPGTYGPDCLGRLSSGVVSVLRHSQCPSRDSQGGRAVAGSWGRPLPRSPRTPGHCPPHAVGTSSPGPDSPECLMPCGRLAPGPAGLRWGRCGSVSTCLCGALQGHGGSSGFVPPAWLCPRSSRDLAVGALGRGLGVCHVDATRHLSLRSQALPRRDTP